MPQTYTVPKYIAGTATGTLGGAAQKMGISLQQLLEANPQYKANPNLVQVGATLKYPTMTPTSPVITTETLNNQQGSVNLGIQPQDITNYSNILASAKTMAAEIEDPSTKLFKDYMTGLTPPPSEAERYTKTYGAAATPEEIAAKELTVKTSTDTINALKAQIQGIVNQGIAQNLALEAQGAGITAGGVQRSQQANLREIAIQVLPLESQVLTEQATLSGNIALLQQAQSKVETFYKLESKDVQRQYDYQKDLRDKVFNFASAEQKRLFTQQEKEDTRAYNLMINNLNQAQNWAATAITQGQGALTKQIMALDPYDKDYQSKLGELAAQIQAQAKPEPAPEPVKESPAFITLQRLLEGGGSINDLPPSQKQAVQNEAYSMGLYSNNVPKWFKQLVENHYQQSFAASKLQQLWDEYRSPIVSPVSETGKTSEEDIDALIDEYLK